MKWGSKSAMLHCKVHCSVLCRSNHLRASKVSSAAVAALQLAQVPLAAAPTAHGQGGTWVCPAASSVASQAAAQTSFGKSSSRFTRCSTMRNLQGTEWVGRIKRVRQQAPPTECDGHI